MALGLIQKPVTATSQKATPVENEYEGANGITQLLEDQERQTTGFIQWVEDASDDPTVESGAAYYVKKATNTADLGDYRKMSDAEVTEIESGIFTVDGYDQNENYVENQEGKPHIIFKTPFVFGMRSGGRFEVGINLASLQEQIDENAANKQIEISDATGNFTLTDAHNKTTFFINTTVLLTITVPSSGLRDNFICYFHVIGTGSLNLITDGSGATLITAAGTLLTEAKAGLLERKLGTYNFYMRGDWEE